MGIRFNTNTWRAPLLLIDSWLPTTTQSSNARTLLPRAVQRFVRAGWLGCTAEINPIAAPCPAMIHRPHSPVANGRACHVRVLRAAETPNSHPEDTRLVISGRINDVCAELDRLAALEHPFGSVRA